MVLTAIRKEEENLKKSRSIKALSRQQTTQGKERRSEGAGAGYLSPFKTPNLLTFVDLSSTVPASYLHGHLFNFPCDSRPCRLAGCRPIYGPQFSTLNAYFQSMVYPSLGCKGQYGGSISSQVDVVLELVIKLLMHY